MATSVWPAIIGRGHPSPVEFLRETELALMNAPFDPGGWVRAIDMVARACRSDSANLVAIGGPLLLPLNIFTGPESERAATDFARPELWGACNWRVRSAGSPMSVQHEAHYAAARAMGGTEEYDDAVSDLNAQYGCQSVLISDERNFLGLALLRGRHEGPSDETVLRRFQHLIRHVQRALRVQLALDGEAAELMLGELETVSSPTFLLDRHGCLCAMTAPAEALLDDHGPAQLSGLAFRLRHPEEDRQLAAAMARLLAAEDGAGGPQMHEMKVGRSAARPAGRWHLSVIRLPRRSDGLGFEAQLVIMFSAEKGAGFARWAGNSQKGESR